MKNEILRDARDIVLIMPSSDPEKYVFAAMPSKELARKNFDATLTNSAEANVNGFNRYWIFNERTGEANGSNLYLAIRQDKVVRAEGLWLPGVTEARILEAKGKITNGVYRDLGAVAYSDASPNQELAHSLITTAKRTELPVIFSPGDLDYKINEYADNGVEIFAVENSKRIVSGTEAQEILRKFNYKASSGAHGLGRCNVGSWLAVWNLLGNSVDAGRVGDWICGEAARVELKAAQESLGERNYGKKIKELQVEQKNQAEEFARELGV